MTARRPLADRPLSRTALIAIRAEALEKTLAFFTGSEPSLPLLHQHFRFFEQALMRGSDAIADEFAAKETAAPVVRHLGVVK